MRNMLYVLWQAEEAEREEVRRDSWRIAQRLLRPRPAPPKPVTPVTPATVVEVIQTSTAHPVDAVPVDLALFNIRRIYQHRDTRPVPPLYRTPVDERSYADGPWCKDEICCPEMYCSGQTDVDGFQRRAVIGFLLKAMVFVGYGRSKPPDVLPTVKLKVKTRRAPRDRKPGRKPNAMAARINGEAKSAVLDVAQDAFVIWWTAKRKGQEISSQFAAKLAVGHWREQGRKVARAEAKAIHLAIEAEKRNNLTRPSPLGGDAVTEELLALTEQEGTGSVKVLAEAAGVSVSTMQAKMRKAKNNLTLAGS